MKYSTFLFLGTKALKSGVYFIHTEQSQFGYAKCHEVISHLWRLTTALNSAGLKNLNTNSQDDLLSRESLWHCVGHLIHQLKSTEPSSVPKDL